jgi:hypothetical protein
LRRLSSLVDSFNLSVVDLPVGDPRLARSLHGRSGHADVSQPRRVEQALVLAAGQSASTAAEALQIPERSVARWVSENPAAVAEYARQKAAQAARIAAEHIEAVTRRQWEALETVEITSAKDLQAFSVAAGIGIDKMRLNAGLDAGIGRVIPAAFRVVEQLSDEELRRLADGSENV